MPGTNAKPHNEDLAPSGPVDRAHLARQTFGDRELEREVLDLFRNQSPLYLDRAKSAQSESEWREAVHGLKGSARSIGAWRIAEAAERAETGNFASRVAAIAQLESALDEVNSFLDELLEARKSSA
jgi:HPt (histidine-containing phosphotransfer) domain-containing protein